MSLMNAVANVLLGSYAMNRYFHVEKNVKQRCILDFIYPLGKKNGKEVKHGDVVKKIISAWKVIVESPTQELYANALVEF
jgi:hypothetical protein